MSNPTPVIAATQDQPPQSQASPMKSLKRRLLRYLAYTLFHASVWMICWRFAAYPLIGGSTMPLWQGAAFIAAVPVGICAFLYSIDLSPRERRGPIVPIAVGWVLSSACLGMAAAGVVTFARFWSGSWLGIVEGTFFTIGLLAVSGFFAICGERLSASCEPVG